MNKQEKTRPTYRKGDVSWNDGEREKLIAEALAKGNVTHVPTGESGPEQTYSSWRARNSAGHSKDVKEKK